MFAQDSIDLLANSGKYRKKNIKLNIVLCSALEEYALLYVHLRLNLIPFHISVIKHNKIHLVIYDVCIIPKFFNWLFVLWV